MNPHRPEARIAEQDFEARARSRIALQNGVDVFADAGKQSHEIKTPENQ
jgi:hypothetical protein